jgi:hypothetical protein
MDGKHERRNYSMTDKCLTVRISLNFSQTGSTIDVDEPTLVSEAMVDQAHSLIDNFLMDEMDKLEPDITDEAYRERFIELLYYVVYREVVTLRMLPMREWAAMSSIKKGKRYYGPPKRRKGES